ncbi:MAG: hypothetical protein J6386_12910 [Candidatus Synoicihabitans palmerolidicus]|nr:hypothetical protein [Candidatus Synoicihabitans palmerolidicus]
MAQHKGKRLEPRYISIQSATLESGREIMSEFRRMGLPGDYFLEFNLRVLPRRGKASVLKGAMWGARNDIGPIFRSALFASSGEIELQLLGQSGPQPSAWRHRVSHSAESSLPTGVEQLGPSTLLDPILGTGISMFELQMPFIYWDDFIYEGVTKILGRAVHAFLMYPPDSFAAARPEIAGVRLHLDAQFNALMQAVILDGNESTQRKLTVLDLKKLDDQWIVKSIDVRDEKTRDKVRFEVTGAALDLEFAAGLFAPAALMDTPGTPIGVTRF